MIKSITITNFLGESIELELMSPEKSGLAVLEIKGLGPAKANITNCEMVDSDISVFNSSKLKPRNITMKVMPLESPTIEDGRHRLYKYFPIKQRLKLTIKTDRREAYTYGYVESNEPDIFNKREQSQISIICPDPYFYDVGIQTTSFSGIEALFEFPFENDSLDEKLIEIGNILIKNIETVFYEGDAEIGVLIRVHCIGTVGSIVIYNTITRETMRIDNEKIKNLTGSGLVASDDVVINTMKGQKSIYLLRSGKQTDLLNCLDRNTDWFSLTKGDNLFAYTADEGSTNVQVTIQSLIAYEGM